MRTGLKTINIRQIRGQTWLGFGAAEGRRFFLASGFIACRNGAFLRLGNTYAHHNRILKAWILE